MSLFSYILFKATNYIFRHFIAGFGTLEFDSGILKSLFHSILQYLKIVTCTLLAEVRTQAFFLLIFIG